MKYCLIGLLNSLLIASIGTGVQASSNFPLKTGDRVYVITSDKSQDDTVRFDSTIKSGFVIGFANETLYLGKQWDVRLDRVIKLDGSSVLFPIVGALYDSATESVSGIDELGRKVSISITEVDHVEIMWRVKSNIVPIILSARMLHRRLRFVDSYPEVNHQVPLDSIREIKKWNDRTSTFTFVGMLAGGVLGYYSASTEGDNAQDTSWFDFSMSDGTIRTLSTITGVVLGGILGHIVGKGGWKKVPVEKMRVSLSPTYNDGFGLKLAVNF